MFPEEISESVIVNDFYYLYRPILWVNPDIQVFLSCTYNQGDFENEISRLAALSSSREGYNTKFVKYDEEIFEFPAYYTFYAFFHSFEYALLDYETNTIIYVSMQYEEVKDIHFDNQYLPINYAIVYKQDSESPNSFSMYIFDNEDRIPSDQD